MVIFFLVERIVWGERSEICCECESYCMIRGSDCVGGCCMECSVCSIW